MRMSFTIPKVILFSVLLAGCCEKAHEEAQFSQQASTEGIEYTPLVESYPLEELSSGDSDEYEYGGYTFKVRDGFTVNDEIILRKTRRKKWK